EERLRLVLRVVQLRERTVDREQAGGAQAEAAPLETGDDLAGQRTANRVRLRQDQRLFDRHPGASLLRPRTTHPPPPRLEARQVEAGRLDGRLAERADLPQRLERRVALHARLLEPCRADGANEERRLDRRAADGALAVAKAEALLHRPDLQLAL